MVVSYHMGAKIQTSALKNRASSPVPHVFLKIILFCHNFTEIHILYTLHLISRNVSFHIFESCINSNMNRNICFLSDTTVSGLHGEFVWGSLTVYCFSGFQQLNPSSVHARPALCLGATPQPQYGCGSAEPGLTVSLAGLEFPV